MSNQVNLMLRPPPNVDFVNGYPGIPPMAPDRPQASVKGEVEVRVSAHGVKAKWVRIELRKVETLPSGTVFYDFVGPSPITLWSAGDEEYQTLHGANYPFSIRIPESIPPSIALENRAGIKYELVASVCVKGKRKMLRSSKAQVVTYIAPIIIDKHELHSTWPVYCQPDKRQVESNGLTLHIERNHTCYGPGDRITLSAILKSQSIHAVTLRGFEFSLNELSVFRGASSTSPGGQQSSTKSLVVDESKVPVNVTLYGGTQHRAELAVGLSPRHTTTTLNAARYIDITYTLRVVALLANGEPLKVELPVIISNWQREVSEEAIKRIGPAPSLSLTQPTDGMHHNNYNNTYSGRPSSMDKGGGYQASQGKFSTMPNGAAAPYDDFGYTKPSGKMADFAPSSSPPSAAPTVPATAGHPPPPMTTLPSTTNRTSVFQVDEVTGRAAQGRRPVSARSTDSTGTGARLTVVNPGTQQWMSAEEEKAKLFSMARDKVDKIQGTAPKPVSSSPTTPKKSPGGGPWLSAEEEKARLFNEARATADRTQAINRQSSDRPTTAGGSAIGSSSSPATSSMPIPNTTPSSAPLSAAAAMYQSAMASRNTSANPSSKTVQQPQPHTSAVNANSAKPATGRAYMSAEEEKAQLRRYHEAKQAVERTQGVAMGGGASAGVRASSPPPPHPSAASSSSASSPAMSSGSASGTASSPLQPPPPIGSPIPYDSLYAPQGAGAGPAHGDMPPPFAASGSSSAFNPNLSEKERVKRAYESQDASGSASGSSMPPPASEVPAYSPPAASSGSYHKAPIVGKDILSEKERLRRKYAEEDAAALAAQQSQSQGSMSMGAIPPYSPPAHASVRSRPTPPPSIGTSPKALSAEEEKARLKAKYAAQDQGATTNGHVNGNGHGYTPMPTPSPAPAPAPTPSPTLYGNIPPPPPLMPRPPAEYIRETKEEDARVARYVSSDGVPPIELEHDGVRYDVEDGDEYGVYANGNGNGNAVFRKPSMSPAPPLPPKPISP